MIIEYNYYYYWIVENAFLFMKNHFHNNVTETLLKKIY